MKKQMVEFFGLLIILLCVFVSPALGIPITFSDSDIVGGYTATGSSDIDYTLMGNTLTIAVDNTSPLTDSGGNSNSPAIVGFGFDTSNEIEGDLSVEAYGFLSGPSSGSLAEITAYWQLSTDSNLQGGNGGIVFDFVPNTTNGVQYGLINPAADGLTGSNLFETTATFTIVFNNTPGDISNWYMRFRNLGLDGEGSLNNVPPAPVPEPATMFLFGSGLLGILGFRKKFKKS
ncbi:MAG: PEP-CTERM sorting domain-containing protein [Deltaproteobacteria bacterium]|nr:PEP-CTERM sorting domain-containing protein [Deltaproteobacteria bacterium]